ncbi:MAG TPA: hypothetical protein VF773_09545 [Verrucomicrobiae bacterium]
MARNILSTSGQSYEVIESRRLEKGTHRKKWHRTFFLALAVGVGGLLVLAAFVLPPVFREAVYLVEKLRYTSICTRCGEQQSSVYYLVLGTEVVRSEQVLPISTATLFNAKTQARCDHDSVLIGKTTFGITKALEVNESTAGTPSGWDFKGMHLAKTLSQLKEMRTGAVLGHMQALVHARDRGDRVGTGLLTGEI